MSTTIEARVYLEGENENELVSWVCAYGGSGWQAATDRSLRVGKYRPLDGDYVIKVADGDFRVMSPERFHARYRTVGASGSRTFVLAKDAEPKTENWMQDQVRRFQVAFGAPAPDRPQALPADRVALRIELIREEFEDELIPALESGNLIESIDAAIDILYVTFGLLVEMGVPASPFFDEVHSSNMSKLGEDGKPIIAGPLDPDGLFEGRVKKGPHYFRPNLQAVLNSLLVSEES